MKTKVKPKTVRSFPSTKKKFNLDYLYIFILMLVVLIAFNKVYVERLFTGGDNVVYFITAKAIAIGEGYTNINSPFNTPATWFPPGYPLLSAAAMLLFGEDIQVMNKLNGFLLFGSIVFLFLISVRITKNKHLSFIIALITALNMHMLHYSIIAMSEIPFIFMSLGAIYFFIRMKKETIAFKDINFWLFFFFLMFSYYIRPMGIVLVAASVLHFLIIRNWKMAAIIIAGFIICAAPWYLRNKAIGENRYANIVMKRNALKPEAGNMTTASDWISRVEKNAVRYMSIEIPCAIIGYEFVDYKVYKAPLAKDKNWFLGCLFVALGIIGMYFAGEYKWFIFFYLSGSAAILMLFPDVWFGSRLMLPVVPLLYLLIIIALYEAMIWLSRKLSINENIRISFLPFVFLLFIFVLKDGINYLVKLKTNEEYSPGFARYEEIAKWAKDNIPHNSVVACRKPEFFYLFSDCKTTGYAFTLNEDSLIANMKANKATHVVFDGLGLASTGRYLLPAIKKYSEKFKVVQHLKNPDTYLFEIHYDCGYEGEMKEGKRNGKGISRNAEGTVYDGYWVNNMKEGQGILSGANGYRYEGAFSNNVRNGFGKMYDKNHVLRMEGNWVNDRMNGYAKEYDFKGKFKREGIMKDDKFVSSK